MAPDQLRYIFGVREIPKIEDVPAGAQLRLRLRNDAIAMAFVRTPQGIRKFAIGQYNGRFYLGYEQAANHRVTVQR